MQVYYAVGDVARRSRAPRWIFCDRVDRGWQHIPCGILHPWEVPVKLRNRYATCIMQTGPPGDMITSALKHGIYLRVDHLKELQAIFRFEMPDPGQGSGKNGALIKQDYAQALLDYIFQETVTPAQKKTMLAAIMGKNSSGKHLGRATAHAKDILEAVHGLDTADVPEFSAMAAVCVDELELHKARPNREPRIGGLAYNPRKNITPESVRKDLDSLCPTSTRSKIYRHPKLKRYQAFYIPVAQGCLTNNCVS